MFKLYYCSIISPAQIIQEPMDLWHLLSTWMSRSWTLCVNYRESELGYTNSTGNEFYGLGLFDKGGFVAVVYLVHNGAIRFANQEGQQCQAVFILHYANRPQGLSMCAYVCACVYPIKIYHSYLHKQVLISRWLQVYSVLLRELAVSPVLLFFFSNSAAQCQ